VGRDGVLVQQVLRRLRRHGRDSRAWIHRSSWMHQRRRPGQASIGRASMWRVTWVLGRSADGRAYGAEAPRESVDPG
jgi:hypothetical protein